MCKPARLPGVILILALSVLAGCDLTPREQTQSQPRTTAVPAPKPTAPTEMSTDEAQTDLQLSDLLLGSKTQVISSTNGDLRPLWIVSGRITNVSGSTVTSVRLKLIASEKASGHDLDTAILPIQQNIPPNATVSFRREVQLMLPDRGWAWTCLVDGATVQP